MLMPLSFSLCGVLVCCLGLPVLVCCPPLLSWCDWLLGLDSGVSIWCSLSCLVSDSSVSVWFVGQACRSPVLVSLLVSLFVVSVCWLSWSGVSVTFLAPSSGVLFGRVVSLSDVFTYCLDSVS